MTTLVALEDDKDPDRENEHLHMYLFFSDDESATVEPQDRMSDRSSSPQGKRKSTEAEGRQKFSRSEGAA